MSQSARLHMAKPVSIMLVLPEHPVTIAQHYGYRSWTMGKPVGKASRLQAKLKSRAVKASELPVGSMRWSSGSHDSLPFRASTISDAHCVSGTNCCASTAACTFTHQTHLETPKHQRTCCSCMNQQKIAKQHGFSGVALQVVAVHCKVSVTVKGG
jgi:hypothetical protein